jgi:hypothetical protein
MSVTNGRLTLADGMSYRVLVLPQTARMTPQLAERIQTFVAAGATVVGPIPTNSPSLSGFPDCDLEVQKFSALMQRAVQSSLGEVLSKTGPDFRQLDLIPGAPLRWLHRAGDGVDIYFVANSNAQPVTVACAFRVTGKRPELWHPDTGRTERAAIWEAHEQETRLPLKLDPRGSCFVVFRQPATSLDAVSKLLRNGRPEPNARLSLAPDEKLRLLAFQAGNYECPSTSGRTPKVIVPALPEPLPISGPWELQFAPNLGAPERVTLPQLISWPRHSDPGIKYFSGQATYRKVIKLGREHFATQRRVFLDLGRVEVLAEVRCNGRDLGILWKPPFTVDLTESAHPGDNELEIKVTNLWPNRLIGDEQLPEDCRWGAPDPAYGAPLLAWPSWLLEGKPSPSGRITFATWKHWSKDAALLESGLLGPVLLRAGIEVRLGD